MFVCRHLPTPAGASCQIDLTLGKTLLASKSLLHGSLQQQQKRLAILPPLSGMLRWALAFRLHSKMPGKLPGKMPGKLPGILPGICQVTRLAVLL
jgi:hypothetical protein